jgi:uncharacterized membrane protein YdjX (TVP38/TMEM64 family)
MGVLRARLVKQLRESDRWNRLSIFYPSRRDDDDEFINVHAKVMIIDNVLLRIGSSNLNNRSMGLDSECDLALEGKNEERINKEIARFRSRLLAEHCGVSVQQVEDALAGHESAAAAIRTLSANTRHLEPLEIEVDDLIEDIVPDADLLDPERPISLEKFIHQFSPGLWEQRDGKRKISKNIPLSSNAVKITAISMLLAVLLVLWKWTPLGEWLDANTLAGWGSMVREMPAAPLIVVSTYIVAGLFVFPITVLILATVLAFGPVSGFLYALSGSLVNAAAIYFLGRILGRGTMRKLLGKRLTDLSRRLARQGLLTVVAVRILPVAPFSVINMVAGASHIKFRDFFWGTLIGLFPGILALTAAGKGLGELLFSQKRGSFLSTALLFAAAVVGILFLHLVLKKKTGEKPGSEAGGDE